MFFFVVNILLCTINADLKHKTTGSHASVTGRHDFSCPTRELEIEINYVQYCYSLPSMVAAVIRSLPTLAELRD